MANQPEQWRVEEWSTTAARGTLRSTTGARLPFDASAATVADFVLGEEVQVERTAELRVRRVAPLNPGNARTARLEASVLIKPTGLLALRRPADGTAWFDALEEQVFDQLGISSLSSAGSVAGGHDGFLIDGPEVRPLVEAALGRVVEPLVEVHAEYPFDWSGHRDLDRLFGELAPRLPGFSARSAFFYADGASASDDAPTPPHLSWSIETIGLLVHGVLSPTDWARWRSAFERATSYLAMRTQ